MDEKMNSVPPQLSEFTRQMLQGSGMDIKDMQRTALTKQYNLSLQLVVTEADGNKPFFDSNPMTWTGVPYPFVVAMEGVLVELLRRLNVMGAEVATGGNYTPPA